MIWYIIFAIVLAVLGYVVFSDRFKGYRTQIAASLTAGIGGVLPMLHDVMGTLLPYASDVVTYLRDLDWRQYVSAEKAPWVILGMGIVFYILRRMTTGPVGVK